MENNSLVLRSMLTQGRTLVMGILNVTPDSFFDGGQYDNISDAYNHALKMINDGVDIIDIGGESTRPGFQPVPVEEELERVIPVIKRLREQSNVIISVDTTKYEVAREALLQGADIINDISCLKDERLAAVTAEFDAYYILMHNHEGEYTDFASEYVSDLKEGLKKAYANGLTDKNIILDPGVGFAKDTDQNLYVMKHLDILTSMKLPVLLAASRKSVIGNVLKLEKADRLEGTLATTAYGVMHGADVVRVHDVKENVRLIKMLEAIKNYD